MRWLEGPAPHGAGFGMNRYLYRRLPRARRTSPSPIPTSTAPTARASPAGRGSSASSRWRSRSGSCRRPAGPGEPRPDRGRRRRPLAAAAARPQARPVGARQRPLRGTLGLGEAARGYVRALEQAAHPRLDLDRRRARVREAGGRPARGLCPRRVHRRRRSRVERASSSICINADELPRVRGDGRRGLLRANGPRSASGPGRPIRSRSAGGARSSCWTRSGSTPTTSPTTSRARPRSRCAACRRPCLPPEPGDVQLDLGLPDGFRFLFMFDFFSTIQRKNPVGLVEAFRRAFEPGEGPQLVIKTINGVHRPHALEELLWAARGRPDIHVIDRSLSARERDALRDGLRLLRVAAPQRGLRPHAGGVHGARQAGDRDRLLRPDGLHDRGEQLSGAVRDHSRRSGLRDLSLRRDLGRPRRRRRRRR